MKVEAAAREAIEQTYPDDTESRKEAKARGLVQRLKPSKTPAFAKSGRPLVADVPADADI